MVREKNLVKLREDLTPGAMPILTNLSKSQEEANFGAKIIQKAHKPFQNESKRVHTQSHQKRLKTLGKVDIIRRSKRSE
jgi:hypothetical protein